jgi:hypothetical protein
MYSYTHHSPVGLALVGGAHGLEGLDVAAAPRGARVEEVGQEGDHAQLLGACRISKTRRYYNSFNKCLTRGTGRRRHFFRITTRVRYLIFFPSFVSLVKVPLLSLTLAAVLSLARGGERLLARQLGDLVAARLREGGPRAHKLGDGVRLTGAVVVDGRVLRGYFIIVYMELLKARGRRYIIGKFRINDGSSAGVIHGARCKEKRKIKIVNE